MSGKTKKHFHKALWNRKTIHNRIAGKLSKKNYLRINKHYRNVVERDFKKGYLYYNNHLGIKTLIGYQCKKCNKQFDTIVKYRNDFLKCNKSFLYGCKIRGCKVDTNKNTNDLTKALDHMYRHIKDKEFIKKLYKKYFFCLGCDKKFARASNVINHCQATQHYSYWTKYPCNGKDKTCQSKYK